MIVIGIAMLVIVIGGGVGWWLQRPPRFETIPEREYGEKVIDTAWLVHVMRYGSIK